MLESLSEIDTRLRKEADELLSEKGLHRILGSYGRPHYTGSYALKLMTWRDLDIYVENDELNEPDFFELGKQVNQLLSPVKMSFRNETRAKTAGLPNGLYWGVYLGDERNGAWKIDIWMMNNEECKKNLEYCDNLEERLTFENRETILLIKSACWQNPMYRRSFSSADIYKAVLDHGIKDLFSFQKYLTQRI
jgi:hypothetical protein